MNWPRTLTIPRAPDFVIVDEADPYLRRWYVIPRNRWFNIYLHQFLRDDDDRALHGHPWLFNCSILLRGRYSEVVPQWLPPYRDYIGQIPTCAPMRRRWLPHFRRGASPHRVVLERDAEGHALPVWTLFITGPVIREWGFYCPHGWRHWREFVDARDHGSIGRGCE